MEAAYHKQLMPYGRSKSFRYWFRMEESGQEQFGIKHESAAKNKRVLQLKLNRQHCLLYQQGKWRKISPHHDTHFGITIVTKANCQAKVTCAWNLDDAPTENNFVKDRNAPNLHPV